MPKYQVRLQANADLFVTVEADDKESAVKKAFDNSQYLCAQCSGWGQEWSLDLGEWTTENPDGTESNIDDMVTEA